jgi:hypothetical protein
VGVGGDRPSSRAGGACGGDADESGGGVGAVARDVVEAEPAGQEHPIP